ncbi:hypothetical protein QMG83_13280 [Salinibacterium sp. G-O1]|uniref:hypothetical protein n=1 Tax=Salinibacterium sp. G-O1 TaxID=3046208 RepID=UPI0024BAD912|nr:hypothetical protein [Salinibacterium sp. G-O1]MDJ0336198.1 hypothetical protein [Salinibacterium sp. G-O1]
MSYVRDGRSRHPFLIALSVLIFAQCALLLTATGYLVIELIVDTPDSYASAVALAVLTVIAAVWLAVIAVNVLRGSPWVRGATVVVQALQIAVAIGAFQGAFARPDLGWLLLIPAIIALVLLFTSPVVAATARRS